MRSRSLCQSHSSRLVSSLASLLAYRAGGVTTKPRRMLFTWNLSIVMQQARQTAVSFMHGRRAKAKQKTISLEEHMAWGLLPCFRVFLSFQTIVFWGKIWLLQQSAAIRVFWFSNFEFNAEKSCQHAAVNKQFCTYFGRFSIQTNAHFTMTHLTHAQAEPYAQCTFASYFAYVWFNKFDDKMTLVRIAFFTSSARKRHSQILFAISITKIIKLWRNSENAPAFSYTCLLVCEKKCKID